MTETKTETEHKTPDELGEELEELRNAYPIHGTPEGRKLLALADEQNDQLREAYRLLFTECVRRRDALDSWACRLCWGRDGHYDGDTRSDVTHDSTCPLKFMEGD